MSRTSRAVIVSFATALAACALGRVAQAEPMETPERGSAEARAGTPGAARDAARGDVEASHPSRRTDHFRIGALGGVGFPRPLAIEGMILLERALGLGVEYSFLPKMTIASVEASFWAVAADARIFPFRDGFFLGARAGHQRLGGQATVTVPRYGAISEALAIDTTFVNPRIGFLWTWEPGVTIGLDAGVQIPLRVTASNTLPAGSQVSRELDGVATSFGRNTIPTIDLLRVGILL